MEAGGTNTAQAIGQPIRPTQAIRSAETVRATAETVRPASEPVRPSGLGPPAPFEHEAVRQPLLRWRLLGRLTRRRARPLGLWLRRPSYRLRGDLLGFLRGAEIFLDHLLDRRVTEVVEFVLQGPRLCELHAAVRATCRIQSDWRLAHRAWHGRIDRLGGLGFALQSPEPTLLRELRLPELGMQFRLEFRGRSRGPRTPRSRA